MSTNPCPTAERLASTVGDARDRSLHDHVAACPACQDALLVAAALAAAVGDDAPLPDPRVLWLRARREARARAARRATRVIGVVQVAAATLLAGALVAVGSAFVPPLGDALAESALRLVAAPGMFGLPLPALAGLLALVALSLPPLVALADRV
jgi:hypothetical protein